MKDGIINLNFFATKYSANPIQQDIYLHLNNKKLVVNTIQEGSLCELSEIPYGYSDNNSISNNVNVSNINTIFLDKVLENIRDIRPLLALLREYCRQYKIKLDIKFSDKLENRRFWNDQDIKKLIYSSGFSIDSYDVNTKIYTLVFSDVEYNLFLKTLNFPKDDIEHIMVTTEHSDYRITGGIGSYVKECEKLYKGLSDVLIIDNSVDLDETKIFQNNWFSAQSLIGNVFFDSLMDSNYDMFGATVYESFKQILFYYPRLKVIEAQELLLDRVIDAKRQENISNNIVLATICHGSSFHLARAKKDMLELEQIHVAYREKYTIENSDVTIFPTNYLKESYEKVGIEGLDNNNKVIKRLPFDLSRIPAGDILEEYNQIIYIGKLSAIKGFDIFLRTLLDIYKFYPKTFNIINDVTVIVTNTEFNDKNIRQLYNQASKHYNIHLISLEREDLLAFLAKSSKNSIVLVTYPGDNHPTVILELMAIGHDFIALDCGGTPELIPNGFFNNFIVNNDIKTICLKVEKAFKDINARRKVIKEVKNIYIKEQYNINNFYKINYFDKYITKHNTALLDNNVIVDVSIAGEKGTKYTQTLQSIKAQSYKNINIVSDDIQLKGNYYIKFIAGDTLDPDIIRTMATTLQKDNSSAVYANEMAPVYEGGKYVSTQIFNPVYPQLGSVFLQEKYKRRIVAMFKRSSLPKDYYEFSDWELLIFLKSHKKRILIIPELLIYLERTDKLIKWDHTDIQDSMIKTIANFSKFDAYILYAQLKRLDDLYFGSKLYNHLEDIYIRRDDPSIMHGVTPTTVKAVGAYRRYVPQKAHKIIIGTAKVIHKTGRKLKNTKLP